MALASRITDSKRSIGLVLIATGWLCVPTSQAVACNHSTIVSFASSDSGPAKRTAPLARKPAKPVVGPHNPYDPLGPCQGPQCDAKPPQPDPPMTSTSTTEVRDHWSLAWSETAAQEGQLEGGAWLILDDAVPIQFRDSIFHPPRA